MTNDDIFKHGEDVYDQDWAARPHPLLRINSGLFK